MNGEYGDYCQLTGFLPLHAVVANGHTAMYDFLCDLPGTGIDDGMRANETKTNGLTPMLSDCAIEYGTGLTPLQTACQLDDHKMFKHILGRTMGILWKWGPVTQNIINLDGIDSASNKGGEVLELIGRFDAKIPTQEMLLDDFMEGFLQEIVMEKWEKFGKHMWLVHRLLDLAYLIPVAANALWLKEDPESALNAYWLPWTTLAMAVPSLLEDLRSVVLWVRGGEGRLPHMLTYCNAHGITLKLIGMVITAIACVALINGYRPAGTRKATQSKSIAMQHGRIAFPLTTPFPSLPFFVLQGLPSTPSTSTSWKTHPQHSNTH